MSLYLEAKFVKLDFGCDQQTVLLSIYLVQTIWCEWISNWPCLRHIALRRIWMTVECTGINVEGEVVA